MDTSIDKILSELVIKVIEHFNINPQDALAAVAQSRLANELSRDGNTRNLSIEELCSELYDEIAKGE